MIGDTTGAVSARRDVEPIILIGTPEGLGEIMDG